MITSKILLIASIISAVGVITGILGKTYKALVKAYKSIRNIENKIEEKEEHDKENYKAILRLTIMSQEMPLSERIAAGDKYVALGGNGAVKHKYEELLEKLPKE